MMPSGSYVVSLGWNANGFGLKRGFKKTEIHLFEQQAREEQHTLFVVVERKVQTTLSEFEYQTQVEGIGEYQWIDEFEQNPYGMG